MYERRDRPRVGCLLEIDDGPLRAILLEIQLNHARRPRSASRDKGGEIDRAGFAEEGGGVECAGVDVQSQVLRVYPGERRAGDWSENVGNCYAAEVSGF